HPRRSAPAIWYLLIPISNARFAITPSPSQRNAVTSRSSAPKFDLPRIGQQRAHALLVAVEWIMLGEGTKREAGALFDGCDPCLRGLVLPEDELLIFQKVLLRHCVAGR